MIRFVWRRSSNAAQVLIDLHLLLLSLQDDNSINVYILASRFYFYMHASTGAALNITTNKKDEICTVNCLDPIDLTLKMTI